MMSRGFASPLLSSRRFLVLPPSPLSAPPTSPLSATASYLPFSTYIKVDHSASYQSSLSPSSPHGSRLHLLHSQLKPKTPLPPSPSPGPSVLRPIVTRNDLKGAGDPGGRFKSSEPGKWGVPASLSSSVSPSSSSSTPHPTVFAVIELGGTQYKVLPGDVIVSEKLRPTGRLKWDRVGEVVDLGKEVLMVAGSDFTAVGLPSVGGGRNGFKVRVRVEEITRDATVVVFKKRRKKHSRRRNGFRRQVTLVRILGVSDDQGVFDEEVERLEREGVKGWVTSSGRVHGIDEVGGDVDVIRFDENENENDNDNDESDAEWDGDDVDDDDEGDDYEGEELNEEREDNKDKNV